MDLTIYPGKLQGSITAIPSKSQAHRLLICAALSDHETTLICPETNRDIDATVDCLKALGAEIIRTDTGFSVCPISNLPESAMLNCCESGSTLRFMLPIVGALGVDTVFQMEGRLPSRPLSPLWEELERMGCSLSRPTPATVRCQGKLIPGGYSIDGSVSSQFVTGLLFALTLIDGKCSLEITGKIESKPYIDITKSTMAQFNAPNYRTPGQITVEGDWSNSAFFLAANALGSQVAISNLNTDSPQGDRAAAVLIPALKENITIDIGDIPDLVPILSVVAATNQGGVFTNIGRLRLKESDRVAATVSMIKSLGGQAEATKETIIIHGTGLSGGTVDSHNDHRIAMAAAIAATVCTKPVTIIGADAVNKSYPKFWDEYRRLGGNYEQHIR